MSPVALLDLLAIEIGKRDRGPTLRRTRGRHLDRRHGNGARLQAELDRCPGGIDGHGVLLRLVPDTRSFQLVGAGAEIPESEIARAIGRGLERWHEDANSGVGDRLTGARVEHASGDGRGRRRGPHGQQNNERAPDREERRDNTGFHRQHHPSEKDRAALP